MAEKVLCSLNPISFSFPGHTKRLNLWGSFVVRLTTQQKIHPIGHKHRGICSLQSKPRSMAEFLYYPFMLHRSWKPWFETAKPKDTGTPHYFLYPWKCLLVVRSVPGNFPCREWWSANHCFNLHVADLQGCEASFQMSVCYLCSSSASIQVMV